MLLWGWFSVKSSIQAGSCRRTVQASGLGRIRASSRLMVLTNVSLTPLLSGATDRCEAGNQREGDGEVDGFAGGAG